MNPLPQKYRKSGGGWELNVESIPFINENGNKQLHPSTRAMLWTLCGTKVYRIINQDDLNEYLYRLGCLLYVTGLNTSIPSDEILFRFRIKNQTYSFTPEDILKNVGIQANDMLFNYCDFWFQDRNQFSTWLVNANAISLLAGGALPLEMSDTMKRKGEGVLDLDEASEDFANLFRDHVLSKDLEGILTEVKNFSREKRRELQARRFYYYNQAPIFEMSKLDRKVLLACKEHVSQYEGQKFFAKINDNSALEIALIQLAWLFANEYVLLSGKEYEFQEGVSVDEDIYWSTNNELDLGLVREIFQLKIIEPLLTTPVGSDG